MDSSTAPPSATRPVKSPPTGRVMDVLAALSDSAGGRTSAELAKSCGISTSTCALVLAELERGNWVTRRDDRRYTLGSGLFGLVHGLRVQFPLLDRGRDALSFLHTTLGAGCSMSKIGQTHLITVDAVGHGTDCASGRCCLVSAFRMGHRSGWWLMAWGDDDANPTRRRGASRTSLGRPMPTSTRHIGGGLPGDSRHRATGPGAFPCCRHLAGTTGSPRCSASLEADCRR